MSNSQAGADPELMRMLGGTIESTSALAQVTRRLLDYFTSGAIATGGRLPPERQLAATMGVGRSAVREALAALELLGVVSVRPGSGTYLRGSTSELLPETLSWGILLHARKTRELIQVRHALETEAARLLATSGTDETLAALAAHLDTMERKLDDFDAFVTADMLFHQQLAAGTGNDLLRDLLQTVRSLIRVWVERALSDSEHARVTLAEHRAVLDAITDRDANRAAQAMSKHMESAALRLGPTLDEAEP